MAESYLRNQQMERMNERRARAGMASYVPQEPTQAAGQSSRPEYRPDQYQYGGDSMLGKLLPIQRRILKPESQFAEFVGYDDTGRPIYDVVTTPAELGPTERGPSLMSRMLGGLKNAYSATTEDPQAMAGALGSAMRGQIDAAAAGGRVWNPETQQMVEFDPMMAAVGAAPGGVGALRAAEGGSVVLGAMGGKFRPQIHQYAEEAMIDPRILQGGSGKQLSGPRVADIERLKGLSVQTGDNRLPEIKPFRIEDYEGYPIMTSMSDRAAAGDVLQSVNDVPVGVNRRGGQDYMFDPLNKGRVWASDASVITGAGDTRMQTMAEQLQKQYGKDPLFAPWTMAPTGVDYSTMTGETMLQFAKGNMTKTTLKNLDKDIKAIIPDWAGIDAGDAVENFYSASGDQRKKVIQLLDKKYRDKGSLTSGEARIAVTDQQQMLAPDGSLRNVGVIDAKAGPGPSAHPTYNTALSGEGLGRMNDALQVYELFPQAAALGGFNPMTPPRNALRALEMKPRSTLITENLIKQIQARRQ